MKLTYLSFTRIPSLEANAVQVMKMCDAFARLGHEVELHIPRYDIQWTYERVDDPFAYYGVAPGFHIRRLPPWIGLRPGPRHSIPYSLASALRARQRGGIAFGRDIASCALAARLGVPVALELHGPVERDSRWFALLLGSRNLRRVVVISDALRQIMQARFPELEGRLLVAHDGADPLPPDPMVAAPPLDPPYALCVGYIGSLYPGRGIELIVELARRLPWAHFDIVGGSPPEVAAREVETAALANLRLHGHLAFDQAAALRKRADVLLAPYQHKLAVAGGGADTSQWMSPIKLFEYMAAGKAILCSDLPVLREVLRNNQNALLCPPDDVGAWEQALRRLVQDLPLFKMLCRQATADFLQQYTWLKRAEKIAQSFG